MEALNLLLATLALWAARAVVLAIWMIVLIILCRVGRMVDFLLLRTRSKCHRTKSNFLPSNGCSMIGGLRMLWARHLRSQASAHSRGGCSTAAHFDARREGAAEADAYKQLKREKVARDFLAVFSESYASARVMKEEAAEVDAYWQRVREEGKDCHTASSECSASTLA
jgi:hypothetical protein